MADRRQQLYDRIRASSKDEVVLEEMVRHGFWPARTDTPSDPADEVRRTGELQRRLDELRGERGRLHDVERLRAEARVQRLADSRAKRKETKLRRLRERAERAAQWRRRKAREILFLGDSVSAGLSGRGPDRARLESQGLPVLDDAAAVAAAIGITIGELRFLTFARAVSRTHHYRRFTVPKKTGGERLIAAPMPRLKRAQRWLADLLAPLALDDAAHGFRADRSIVTNAAPHVGAAVVVNLDLRDFFPTLDYRRVKGIFTGLGFGEQVATLLGLLATAPDVETVELDGQVWHVATTERRLPQGSPASPALSNLACRRLDRRLRGVARKLGFAYTRYADDLTFSAPAATSQQIARVLSQVEWVAQQEGFAVHPDKTRVLRRGRRQEVTGLVVNTRIAVPRDQLRRFRALLHRLERGGAAALATARWNGSSDVLASAAGFAAYVAMVDAPRGAALVAQVERLRARLGR